jgi:hypothetical protein
MTVRSSGLIYLNPKNFEAPAIDRAAGLGPALNGIVET